MITLINSRVVAAHRESDFRAWAERVGTAAEAQPGFTGALRIAQSGGIFHLIHRFEDEAASKAWEASAAWRALNEEARAFATPRRVVVEGALPWVQLPGEADAPKWKRFLMIWAAALPVAVTASLVFSALGDPLPAPVQAAITSLLLVATMTFVILPRLSGWLQPWVLRDEDGRARVTS
jgi:hypothetical protein